MMMYPRRKDIRVLPSDKGKSSRIGWTITESIGVVVINDHALARVQIEPSVPEYNIKWD